VTLDPAGDRLKPDIDRVQLVEFRQQPDIGRLLLAEFRLLPDDVRLLLDDVRLLPDVRRRSRRKNRSPHL
jgi:hypothetical protein